MQMTWHPAARRLLLVLAALCPCSAANGRSHRFDSSRPSVRDQCSAVEGYDRFRVRLSSVVERRDGVGLRALFHSKGAMRMNGIGGTMAFPDWGFDRPGADQVWRALDEIIGLGCARRGEKLIMPAMAALAYDGLDDGHAVALRNVALRSRPSERAPTKRLARRGEVLSVTIPDVVSGWTELLYRNKRVFVPSNAVRSPHSTRLELSRENGRWTIEALGSGI